MDMVKFLENIRQTIQKITQQQERLKIKDKDKNREIGKSKARKKIVGKLSNPVVRIMQGHRIINYEKQVVSENSKANNNSAISSAGNTGRTSSFSETSLINKKLKDVLMPLKVPFLNEILKRIKSDKNSVAEGKNNSGSAAGVENIEDLRRWTEEVIDWFYEATRGARMFWSLVDSHFQQNPDGYKYLQNQECKGEFLWNAPSGNFMRFITISSVRLENVMSFVTDILYYYSVSGGKKAIINKDININSPNIPLQIEGKSLCYNLVALDMYGLKKVKKLGNELGKCLSCYEYAFLQSDSSISNSKREARFKDCKRWLEVFDGCEDTGIVGKRLGVFKNTMDGYYKRMKMVFEKKLLSALVALFRSNIENSDINNSGDSPLYLLLFYLYNPVINLIKNSFESLRLQLQIITGDLYLDDKNCKLSREFLERVKDIIDERFEKFLKQLQKVSKKPGSGELETFIAMTDDMQRVAREVKELVTKEAGAQLDDCSINKLFIWNSVLTGEPSRNILSIKGILNESELEKYFKRKVGSAPLELQKTFETLINEMGEAVGSAEKSGYIIGDIELYLTKIYEELLYLFVLYNIIIERQACSDMELLLKEFEIKPDIKQVIVCLFESDEKELTECFSNKELKSEFDKIVFFKVWGGGTEEERYSKFSLPGLLQFIYNDLFSWDSRGEGYYINFPQTCINVTANQKLQKACVQLSSAAERSWNDLCPKIQDAFADIGGVQAFPTYVQNKCLHCIEKKECKYASKCVDASGKTNPKCRYPLLLLLEAGCKIRKGEAEAIGTEDKAITDVVPHCCQISAGDLKNKCIAASEQLPQEMKKLREGSNIVYVKTASTKIDINKILLNKLEYILGEGKFNKYKISKKLKDRSEKLLPVDIHSCHRQ